MRRAPDDGAVAIIVAISSVLLFALLAVVVDLGLLRVARSDAQNVADNAALAAAWASCNGGDPETAGVDVAARNGVDPSSVTVTGEGGGGWTATVDVQVDAPFAPAIGGPSTLGTGANATARCDPGGPSLEPALFADGSCGNQTLRITGSGVRLNGDVHSNDWMHFGGAGNRVDGEGTYVDRVTGRITWNPAPNNPRRVQPRQSRTFDIDEYRPGGRAARAAGARYYDAGSDDIDRRWLLDQTPPLYDAATQTIRAGLYYTRGDIHLPEVDGTAGGGGITLVSRGGRITLGGAADRLTPFTGNLLAFSNENLRCNRSGVVLGGSASRFEGIVYAPRSRAEVSGSGNALSGIVIAESILVNGASTTIRSNVQGPPRPPGLAVIE